MNSGSRQIFGFFWRSRIYLAVDTLGVVHASFSKKRLALDYCDRSLLHCVLFNRRNSDGAPVPAVGSRLVRSTPGLNSKSIFRLPRGA